MEGVKVLTIFDWRAQKFVSGDQTVIQNWEMEKKKKEEDEDEEEEKLNHMNSVLDFILRINHSPSLKVLDQIKKIMPHLPHENWWFLYKKEAHIFLIIVLNFLGPKYVSFRCYGQKRG